MCEIGCFCESNTFYHFFVLDDGCKSIPENVRLFQDLGIFRNERGGSSLFSAKSTGWTDAKVRPRCRLENLAGGGRSIVRSKGKPEQV